MSSRGIYIKQLKKLTIFSNKTKGKRHKNSMFPYVLSALTVYYPYASHAQVLVHSYIM